MNLLLRIYLLGIVDAYCIVGQSLSVREDHRGFFTGRNFIIYFIIC